MKTQNFSDPQARKENINDTAKINKEFHWLPGTCAIVGDSMINSIDEKKITETWQCKSVLLFECKN